MLLLAMLMMPLFFHRTMSKSPLRSGFGEPAIRLWFTCCTMANLPLEDISDVVGSKLVTPFANYFQLEYRPSSGPVSVATTRVRALATGR